MMFSLMQSQHSGHIDPLLNGIGLFNAVDGIPELPRAIVRFSVLRDGSVDA